MPALIRIVLCLGAIMALTFQVSAFSGRASTPFDADPIAAVGSEADGTVSTALPQRSTGAKRSLCQQTLCHSESLMAGLEMISHLPSAKRQPAVLRGVHLGMTIEDVDERPPNSRDL